MTSKSRISVLSYSTLPVIFHTWEMRSAGYMNLPVECEKFLKNPQSEGEK